MWHVATVLTACSSALVVLGFELVALFSNSSRLAPHKRQLSCLVSEAEFWRDASLNGKLVYWWSKRSCFRSIVDIFYFRHVNHFAASKFIFTAFDIFDSLPNTTQNQTAWFKFTENLQFTRKAQNDPCCPQFALSSQNMPRNWAKSCVTLAFVDPIHSRSGSKPSKPHERDCKTIPEHSSA